MPDAVPREFVNVLIELTRWFETAKVPGVVIGGVAASLLGRPRATRDIDALIFVAEDRWGELIALASGFGMAPRVDNPLGFAARTRVLLLRHVATGIDIDVIVGGLPFEEEAIARAAIFEVGGAGIRLPRVEDLLVMKAVAQRPQDMRDIEGLLDAHPEADVASARRWIMEFATAMTMPDMVKEFDKLVSGRRS